MRAKRQHVVYVFALAGDALAEARDNLADLLSRDIPVTVVTCARAHDARAEAGWLAELSAMGVTDHRFLGEAGARWPDKEPRRYVESTWRGAAYVPGSFAPNPEGSLVDAPFGEVSGDIAAVIHDVDAVDLVTHHPRTADPDRIRVVEAAMRAAEVMDIFAFGIEGGVNEQLTIRDDAPATFRQQAPLAQVMFIVTFALIGALTGLLMTAIHQLAVDVGGVPLPWGLAVGFLAVMALVVGLRLALDSRLLAGIAGGAVLAASIFVSGPTRGGSVIVTDNLAGVIWMWALPIMVVVIALWPKIRRSPAGKIDAQPAVKGSSIP